MTTPEREAPADYPSQPAMEAAVAIELMVACGGYATVAYGRAIQKAIDQAAAAPAVTVPEGWQPIETAPKDGTEVLLFREDGGIFLGRYISMIDFLTDAEAADVPMEALEQEDWFYADFLQGGRLEGDQAPTHWQPLPPPPPTTPQTGSQE